jgi:hypothetical protein
MPSDSTRKVLVVRSLEETGDAAAAIVPLFDGVDRWGFGGDALLRLSGVRKVLCNECRTPEACATRFDNLIGMRPAITLQLPADALPTDDHGEQFVTMDVAVMLYALCVVPDTE